MPRVVINNLTIHCVAYINIDNHIYGKSPLKFYKILAEPLITVARPILTTLQISPFTITSFIFKKIMGAAMLPLVSNISQFLN